MSLIITVPYSPQKLLYLLPPPRYPDKYRNLSVALQTFLYIVLHFSHYLLQDVWTVFIRIYKSTCTCPPAATSSITRYSCRGPSQRWFFTFSTLKAFLLLYNYTINNTLLPVVHWFCYDLPIFFLPFATPHMAIRPISWSKWYVFH